MSRLRIAIGVGIAGLVLAAIVAREAVADAPPGRYTIANGTVHDNETGLTWQQTTTGLWYTFSEAYSYCAGLNLDGTGWRVPAIGELQTIIDDSNSPAIDTNALPMPAGYLTFWSSSQVAGIGTSAWRVLFASGGRVEDDYKTDTNRVRCVR